MTWAVVPLAEVAEVRLGRQRSPKNHTGNSMRPYIRAANVTWAGLDLSDVNSMNFTDDEMATYRMEPGDIVLSEASGSPGEVGKPALWSGEIAECAFQNTLIRVRPRQHEPKFLAYYFGYLARDGQFVEHSRGVGIHHIGRARLASWPTPLPPREQQRRIVDLLEDHLSRLDAANAYLDAAQSRSFALLQTVRQAVWRELDGRVRIGDVGAVITGRTPPMSDPASLGCDMPFVTPSDIEFGAEIRTVGRSISRHGAASSRTASPGSVLAVCIGATLGKVGFSNREVSFNQQINAIVLSSRDQAEFLAGVMAAPGFQRQMWESSSATTMPILNKSTFARLEVPAASETDVTRCLLRLRDAASATARLQKEAQRAATRSAILRRSLLAAAFSGRLTGDRAIAGV